MQADVVVVGAGPAGLSTSAALRRLGIAATILEQHPEVGTRWANRYERLRLHTVRRFSGLAHTPLPSTLPRFVPKDDFARYLREYATQNALDVRTGAEVSVVRRLPDGWSVETGDGAWESRAVVVATGKYDRPVVPDWPGRESFRGRLVHSDEYRSAEEYRGLDVLVVGLGNTGAEIAAELAETGAARRVAVAIRTPPPITRRQIAGLPVQYLGIAGSVLPERVGDRLATVLRKVGTGDLTKYGIGAAEWGPFSARRPPVIDVGFLKQLKAGAIEVVPAVERVEPDAVVLAGGRTERFDAVIAATGYRTALPDLLGDEPVAADGLHLVGFTESIRGGLYEIRHESVRVAERIARALA